MEGTYRYNYITFPERNQKYVNSIVRLRVKSSFSVATSVAGLIQYNSGINAVIVNVRLRYIPCEGTDLYLGYKYNLSTNRQSEEPAMFLGCSNSIKMVHLK